MSEGSEIDFNAPEIQAYVQKMVTEAVDGLKRKNDELLGKLKETGEKVAAYGGIDPEKIAAILKRFDDDDESRLIKEGRLDDVIDRRTSKVAERYEAQVAAKDKAMQELMDKIAKTEETANEFQSRYRRSVINNRIASEVEGLRQKALPLVDKIIDGWYDLDEEGKPVPTDRAPLTAKGEALPFEGLREHLLKENDFLFESSQGGGLPVGKANGSGARTMSRAQFEELSPAQRVEFMRSASEGKATVID